MRKVKKMTRVTKRILGAVMGMALLISASDLGCLSAEASDMGQMGETVQLDDDQEIEVLEAIIIEEEDTGISLYTMLSNCSINVGGDSAGMHIDIATNSVGKASVIGVKNVKIQKKHWYGWETVATSDGAEVYNRTSIAISILYPNAEKGETYRILCTHYADVDGYTKCDNDSGSFKFNFY